MIFDQLLGSSDTHWGRNPLLGRSQQTAHLNCLADGPAVQLSTHRITRRRLDDGVVLRTELFNGCFSFTQLPLPRYRAASPGIRWHLTSSAIFASICAARYCSAKALVRRAAFSAVEAVKPILMTYEGLIS